VKAYLYQKDGQLFDMVEDMLDSFVEAAAPFQVSQRKPLVLDRDGLPTLRTFDLRDVQALGDSGKPLAHYYER
jgi:hypothetical protein